MGKLGISSVSFPNVFFMAKRLSITTKAVEYHRPSQKTGKKQYAKRNHQVVLISSLILPFFLLQFSHADRLKGKVHTFLPDPGVPGVRSMGLSVSLYLTTYKTFADVTLADYDTNGHNSNPFLRNLTANLDCLE